MPVGIVVGTHLDHGYVEVDIEDFDLNHIVVGHVRICLVRVRFLFVLRVLVLYVGMTVVGMVDESVVEEVVAEQVVGIVVVGEVADNIVVVAPHMVVLVLRLHFSYLPPPHVLLTCLLWATSVSALCASASCSSSVSSPCLLV